MAPGSIRGPGACFMRPGMSRAEGKKALAAAQAQIAANETWAKRIAKALMSGDGQTTVETADADVKVPFFSILIPLRPKRVNTRGWGCRHS